MATRKQFRLVYPDGPKNTTYGSEGAAYDKVEELRKNWADGRLPSTLTVQVDEGLGFGWQYYEHIDFAEEES